MFRGINKAFDCLDLKVNGEGGDVVLIRVWEGMVSAPLGYGNEKEGLQGTHVPTFRT